MKNMLSMAAAVLTATIMTACAGSDELTDTPQQPENQSKTITLTTTVGLGGGAADAGDEASGASAGTRALTFDGTKGVKTFAAGERMALVYTKAGAGGAKVVVESEALTAEDIVRTPGDDATDKKSATFTFRLTEAPDKTAPVRYIYPAAMAKSEVAADAELDNEGTVDFTKLNAQDGTMGSLASSLDLATYTHAWDGGNLPVGTLANQLAILAITLKDNATSGDITGSITGLTINDGTDTYAVNRSAAAGPIYVAVKPQNSTNFYVSANGVTNAYTKTLAGRQYAAGNGYNVSWRMTENPYALPMTMEALTDGTIVVDKPREGMQYSKNGGAKTAVTSDAISVSAGDKVQFYGNGTDVKTYYSSISDFTSIAGGKAEVKVYGNIMSLVDEDGFATATTLTEKYTFSHLFKGNDKLKDASSLLLPAETLKGYCYEGMFHGCTSLKTAPALNAETLAPSCYSGMFDGCTSLTTAPKLPATTLASSCYNAMFNGCTSLTTAPKLPAKKLISHCYSSMFEGCSSLTTAPALPATTLASSCYYGMFHDCSSLTAAPALPAETLASSCYNKMFQGCTKLSAVTCLATNNSASGCTTDWLKGVAATGTFYKARTMYNWKTNSPSGIPSGWTRVNAE